MAKKLLLAVLACALWATPLAAADPVEAPATAPATKPATPGPLGAAETLLKNKQYDAAIAAYAKILQGEPSEIVTIVALYNTGCAHALKGQKAQAVAFLRKAYDAGFSQYDVMREDPDLAGVREMDSYQRLVGEMMQYVRLIEGAELRKLKRAMMKKELAADAYKMYVDTRRNLIFLHDKSDAEFAAARNTLCGWADYLWANLFTYRPNKALYIVLLTDDDAPALLEQEAGLYHAKLRTVFCSDRGMGQAGRASVVVRELVNALHAVDMKTRRQVHAVWLVEGLASLFDSARLGAAPTFLPDGRLGMLQALLTSPRNVTWTQFAKVGEQAFQQNAELTYGYARYVMLFLHQKGLLKKFYDEYTKPAEYVRDAGGLTAIATVSGKTIDEIQGEWRKWVAAQKPAPVPFVGCSTFAKDEGVVVVYVLPGSPTCSAGLKMGDMLTTIDGKAVTGQGDLAACLGGKKVGDTLALQVKRGDQTKDLKVTVGDRNAAAPKILDPKNVPASQPEGVPWGNYRLD